MVLGVGEYFFGLIMFWLPCKTPPDIQGVPKRAIIMTTFHLLHEPDLSEKCCLTQYVMLPHRCFWAPLEKHK